MSLHFGFSDSVHGDSDPGPYECSDPDCDNGVDCEGLHNYREEYMRLRWGEDDLSQSVNKSVDKSLEKSVSSVDKSVEKSVSSVDKSKHATIKDDVVVDNSVEKSVSSVCRVDCDLPLDDEYVSDSEDACSFS